jgi:hypothetical protein
VQRVVCWLLLPVRVLLPLGPLRPERLELPEPEWPEPVLRVLARLVRLVQALRVPQEPERRSAWWTLALSVLAWAGRALLERRLRAREVALLSARARSRGLPHGTLPPSREAPRAF